MKGKFQEIISQDKLVLVDFYADWCGPCQMMAPVLKEVASELGDQASIIKVDVDPQPAHSPTIRGTINSSFDFIQKWTDKSQQGWHHDQKRYENND